MTMTLMLIISHLVTAVIGGKVAVRHYQFTIRRQRFRRDLSRAMAIVKVMLIGVAVLVVVVVIGFGVFS
jgi:uncharacterized membrane-anchored protein